jgi:hypothetical protein
MNGGESKEGVESNNFDDYDLKPYAGATFFLCFHTISIA